MLFVSERRRSRRLEGAIRGASANEWSNQTL
jgi:hypothetical protein